jgi:LasA protease
VATSSPVATLAGTTIITPTDTPIVTVKVQPTFRPPSSTPTLDPAREIPQSGVITSTYVVRKGDTLSAIAAATGATVQELMRMNGLRNADAIKIGQVLQVLLPIDGHAPSIKLIPDSELVNSPSASGFDAVAFTGALNGYLNQYSEDVDGAEMYGPSIVMRVAEQFSVNPRLLLALLEYKSGWLSDPSPAGDKLMYPLGYNYTDRQSLYYQLSWTSARLNEGYYGWRYGTRLWVRFANDDGRAYMGNGINAGTAGLQNYLSAVSTRAVWQDVLGNNGFIQTYKRLFGDPWRFELGTLVPPDLQQPAFTLPWSKGQSWLYTGGPHAAWGTGSPWGALDFTPWSVYGCDELSDWVTAIADGTVARSKLGEVVESLDPTGDERVGWSILYLHIGSEDRAPRASILKAGTRIGHPSCEGGVAAGAHVHIVRKYNGEWLNAAGPIPFNLGGWVPEEGDGEYDGSLSNGKLVRTPCECKEEETNSISW